MRHHADVPFHERHDDELLTLDEVAEILRTPENTLRWWRQNGEGPAYFELNAHFVRASRGISVCLTY